MSFDLLDRIGIDEFIKLANECNTFNELGYKVHAGYRYVTMALAKLNMLEAFKIKSEVYRKSMKHNSTLTAEEYCQEFFKSHRIVHINTVKKKLIEAGFKNNCCEICGISVWNGNPISLQLHHIDGNPYNNQLNNLQLLCPNCHTQTENYGSKNASVREGDAGLLSKSNYMTKKCVCDCCGKEFEKQGKLTKLNFCCKQCVVKYNQRKIPHKDILLKLHETMSFRQIAEQFHVSKSTVQYWFKKFEK